MAFVVQNNTMSKVLGLDFLINYLLSSINSTITDRTHSRIVSRIHTDHHPLLQKMFLKKGWTAKGVYCVMQLIMGEVLNFAMGWILSPLKDRIFGGWVRRDQTERVHQQESNRVLIERFNAQTKAYQQIANVVFLFLPDAATAINWAYPYFTNIRIMLPLLTVSEASLAVRNFSQADFPTSRML